MKSKTTKVRRYLAAILTVLMVFQQATTSVIYASSEAAVPTVTEAPAAQTEETPEKQVEETPEEKTPTEGESEQTETSTQDSADKQQEQTEEAVTPVPEADIVSDEAPAMATEAVALSAGTEESNNVPSAGNTNLPSAWVKTESIQKETNGIWTDIGKDEQLDQNSTYHLNVTYEIPNTEKPTTDVTYEYSLPSVFEGITSSGDIFNSSNEKMGTYSVENGKILLNISF